MSRTKLKIYHRLMHLGTYQKTSDWIERGIFVRALWHFLGAPILASYLFPSSAIKVGTLRLFGAKIGDDVTIRPGVRVKYPWKLKVGSRSWIGESCWIDNLADVSIGHDSCVSQGAYLCTGSHDWGDGAFSLRRGPISIGDHCWVCAMSIVAPSSSLAEGAILGLGSVGSGSLEAWTIYSGNPAKKRNERPRPDTRSDEA